MPLIKNLSITVTNQALDNLIRAGFIDIYLNGESSFTMHGYDPDHIGKYTFMARSTLLKTIATKINTEWGY